MLSQSNYHYNKYTKTARQKEVRFPQFEDWNKKLINSVVCGLVDPLLIEISMIFPFKALEKGKPLEGPIDVNSTLYLLPEKKFTGLSIWHRYCLAYSWNGSFVTIIVLVSLFFIRKIKPKNLASRLRNFSLTV